MADHLIITVARQFGSEGDRISEIVAGKLGIALYNKELIAIAARESGLNIDLLDKADEKATNSLLYSLALGSYSHGSATMGLHMPINDTLFMKQAEIIRDLAGKQSCLIVGRCADYILKNEANRLSFFIRADMETRIERVMRDEDISVADAKDRIAKMDKRRINYYNFYTGEKGDKIDRFHYSLDSSVLGVEATADLICGIVKDFCKQHDIVL